MRSMISVVFGAAALATASLGAVTPAAARSDVGVYVGPGGAAVSVSSYRNSCRDYWYRRNHPYRCGYRQYERRDYHPYGYYRSRETYGYWRSHHNKGYWRRHHRDHDHDRDRDHDHDRW